MQLKQNCSVCEKRYAKQVEAIKQDTSIPSEVLELTISAIPRPKSVTVEKELTIGNTIMVTYSCKHTVAVSKIEYEKKEGYTSLTKGYESFPYQTEGVKFALDGDINCLIADEMGLGKTVQALLIAREAGDKVKPTVLTVKSATIYQWIRENKEWFSHADLSICPVTSSKSLIFPGFDMYIVSMDLLPDVVDKLIAINPKLVIGDEVQCFKNRESKRSKALVRLCQHGSVKHKIFLSGTPIKNRASEYFTVLNLLAPGHFPSWRQFVSRWLEPNDKGIPTRIRRYAVDDFRKLTSRWVIRRECVDVQKDLPPLRRAVQEIEITDPTIKKSYNQTLDLFSNFLNEGHRISAVQLLGWLVKLRRLTAQAKVPETVELVKSFLDSTEDQKIAIGIHHKSVRDDLKFQLEPYGALSLSGEDSGQSKDWIVQRFKQPENRVLIINEVSGGTGLDGLQVCNNVFVLERQWSAADEEQFEKRFARTGQTKPVLATYLIAHGTIDEYFNEMVETKRDICLKTYGNADRWDFNEDTDGLKALSERVIANRL